MNAFFRPWRTNFPHTSPLGAAAPLLKWLLTIATFCFAISTSPQVAARGACLLEPRPKIFETHAVSTSGRQLQTLAQFDERVVIADDVEVVVSRTELPVILVLSAQKTTVWTIKLAPGANLAGIVIFGQMRQGIVGVDEHTPVIEFSARKWSWQCSHLSFYISDAEAYRIRANNLIKEITGRDVTEFHFEQNRSRIFVGDPPTNWTPKKRDQRRLGFKTYNPTDVQMGRDGLQHLLESGNLRLATTQDIDSWRAGAGEAIGKKPSSLSRLPLEHIYVVAGPVVLPDGLVGSQAVTFLFGNGAPTPTGPRGDNLFYSMTNFECHPQCGLGSNRARTR